MIFVSFKSRFVGIFNSGNFNKIKIGERFKTTSGGTPKTTCKEYYEYGNIPWLTSGEVNKGIITSVDNYITQKGVDCSAAKMVPVDSVVVAMYGATAGKVGLLKISTTTNQAVCSILPNNNYIPEYLYYSLKHREDEIFQMAKGGAQPNISQEVIKSIEIIDAPFDLQKEFVFYVKKINKSKFIDLEYPINQDLEVA